MLRKLPSFDPPAFDFAGCWYEGREVNNGDTFTPAENACRRCTCQDGVITCKDPICDCSAPDSQSDACCPQCNPKASCKHQELHHLVFRSGERWIYQCQTCECLVISWVEVRVYRSPLDRIEPLVTEPDENLVPRNPTNLMVMVTSRKLVSSRRIRMFNPLAAVQDDTRCF